MRFLSSVCAVPLVVLLTSVADACLMPGWTYDFATVRKLRPGQLDAHFVIGRALSVEPSTSDSSVTVSLNVLKSYSGDVRLKAGQTTKVRYRRSNCFARIDGNQVGLFGLREENGSLWLIQRHVGQ